jgi:hypothetical protein
MAARGTIAKTYVENKIKEAFGADFAGIADKKLYIWANDGGERVQIAISMTCPKANIDFGETPVTNSFVDAPAAPVVEMTPEEEKNIQVLLERLGL